MGAESGDRMEIEFTRTPVDLAAFTEYHNDVSPTARRLHRRTVLGLAIAFGLVVLAFGLSYATGRSPEDLYFAAGFCVFAVFYLSVRPWYMKRRTRAVLKALYSEESHGSTNVRARLWIAPEAIGATTELIETKVKWPGVGEIAVTDDYAFVYYAAANAFIVPKRAFPDESSFQSFVEAAKRYHRGAS